MDDAGATAVIWRRLAYMLTPQLDLYEALHDFVRNKRVLEVGFGTGMGTVQYHAYAEYVDAIELDWPAFHFASKALPLRNVRWIRDDFAAPAKHYRNYGFIVMIEVLEHIPNAAAALHNFYKAMQPGGYGVITVPNANRYRKRAERLNVQEWDPPSFIEFLNGHFDDAWQLNSNLMSSVDMGTRESPLIAGVYRAA